MKPYLQFLLAGGSLVLIVAGMHVIAPILNLFLLALLLALSFSPLPEWLIKKKLPRGAAILITVLVVLFGGLLLLSLIGASMVRLVDTLPTYEARLSQLIDSVKTLLTSLGIDLSTVLSRDLISPENLIGISVGFFSGTVQALSNSVLVILLVVFILIEVVRSKPAAEAEQISDNPMITGFHRFGKDVRKYVSITAMTGALAAVGNLILLLILGIDFPILWGTLSFLFNFIPNLGFIFSVIPPALLAMLEFGWERALIVLVGFVIINAVVENIVKPRFMGRELEISLLLIFLSLIFWGWVLGTMGVILAVPLTLVIKKVITEMAEAPVQSSAETSK